MRSLHSRNCSDERSWLCLDGLVGFTFGSQAALLTKERDGLKAILASYEEEEALERSEQGKDATEDARAAKAKIQQLETELAAGREREKELEVRLRREWAEF
jgi:hypothetical protein